jgi:hypothetical protein
MLLSCFGATSTKPEAELKAGSLVKSEGGGLWRRVIAGQNATRSVGGGTL